MPLPREHYRLLERLRRAWPGGSLAGEHVLAAVSGGSDSMALLELLARASASDGCRVTVAYVDHGLRPEATFEAALVRASATRHGMAFEALRIEDPGAGDENHLRERRYQLFEQLLERIGADWLATGHTRDDQIETVLFRIIRGTGLGGLGGMRQQRGNIIRPLLELTRAELQGYLRASAVGWVEDASNRDLRYARNRIRRLVIPAIEKSFGRGALEHIPETARRWQDDEDHLASETARFAAFATRRGTDGQPELDLRALERAPRAVRTRVLRDWLVRAGSPGGIGTAQSELLERLVGAESTGARVELPGVVVVKVGERLRLELTGAAGEREAGGGGGHKSP